MASTLIQEICRNNPRSSPDFYLRLLDLEQLVSTAANETICQVAKRELALVKIDLGIETTVTFRQYARLPPDEKARLSAIAKKREEQRKQAPRAPPSAEPTKPRVKPTAAAGVKRDFFDDIEDPNRVILIPAPFGYKPPSPNFEFPKPAYPPLARPPPVPPIAEVDKKPRAPIPPPHGSRSSAPFPVPTDSHKSGTASASAATSSDKLRTSTTSSFKTEQHLVDREYPTQFQNIPEYSLFQAQSSLSIFEFCPSLSKPLP